MSCSQRRKQKRRRARKTAPSAIPRGPQALMPYRKGRYGIKDCPGEEQCKGID